MSSEYLRETARMMREVAEAATPGRWKALMDGYGDTSGGTSEEQRRDLLWVRSGDTNQGDIVSTYGSPDATLTHDNVSHIAAWHPAVALAVADWLDFIGEALEAPYLTTDSPATERALAVARTWRGDA